MTALHEADWLDTHYQQTGGNQPQPTLDDLEYRIVAAVLWPDDPALPFTKEIH